MKTSAFNFFFPYEDGQKHIAYNSYTNSLALLEKDKYEAFQRFEKHNEKLPEDFTTQLKRGGFIIDGETSELDGLRYRMFRTRFNTDSLNLTIAPTADCNFRCAYCYEKDVLKPDYMSQEVEDAIIKLAESKIKTISILSITWYGGEPLMNMGTIERLSRKFINLCEENGVKYHAFMITNGYLLTPDYVKLLNELKVNSLQVTIDGTEDTHNKNRPLADGSTTYDTIMSNLIAAKDILPNTNLRVNVDKNNTGAWREIAKELDKHGLNDKVKTGLGKITSEFDTYDKNSCFDCGGFSKELLSHYMEFYGETGFMGQYPSAKSNYCGADHENSYCIAADGKLYKCWMEIGREEGCIGSIVDKAVTGRNKHLTYMMQDPTTNNGCSTCDVLPICMGGCPKRKLDGETDCSTYKYVLEGFLQNISKQIKANSEKNSAVKATT